MVKKLFELALAAATMSLVSAQTEQDFNALLGMHEDDSIPLSMEGIPIDMIGHYPSDGPPDG